MSRELTRRAAMLGTALVAAGREARAAPALDRVARIIVGYPPGGPSDITARLYAERLRGVYATQVLVENRPGAASRLAIEAVKAAAPDGSAILMTPESALTIFPHIYRRTLRYDGLTDFTPVSPIAAFPFGFAVSADHPARDIAGFAAWAKARGEEVPFATPAPGSMPHFLTEQLAREIGARLTHVSYRGLGPAMLDLVAGRIAAVTGSMSDLAEQHRSGRLRTLAQSAPERLPRLPDIPSFAEQGLPGLTAEEWYLILLPAGAPPEIVQALHRGLEAAQADPDLRETLTRREQRLFLATPADLARRLRDERERWGAIVRQVGFTAEE